MKNIDLAGRATAIVDDEDFEILSKYSWHLGARGYACRAVRTGKKTTQILMHREIMNIPAGMETDHINRNKIDNRKSNLRICTRTQNEQNKPGKVYNTSGYKGVCWHKGFGKWTARIRVDKKQINLGSFLTAEEAAHVYDKAARKHHGEFAVTNFPEKSVYEQ
jgi:hypothetical protein